MSLLKDNSYHILGLDTSVNQKEVSKRSKEILTRLKIDNVPEYDLDLNLFKDFRNEHSVKDAISNLSTPKKQIKEYFFWFQIADTVDEQAVGIFRTGNFDDAVRVWEHHSSADSAKALLYKKNLAILYSLLLYKEENQEYLKKSVALWGELVNSPKFWSSFSKVYKLHDELGAEQDVIDYFKKHVSGYISDIYTDLSNFHKDKSYITIFTKNFGLKGEKIEIDVLNPIYRVINEAVENLEKMKVSDDGVLDKKESEEIKRLIGTIQTELNKLIDLGLYEESKIKVVRDRAAATLRRLSIELNNNLNETGIALGLAKIAEKISGTESFKSKVQQDTKTLQDNLDYKDKEGKHKTVLDPIIADFHAGRTEKAIQTINGYIYNDDTDKELKETLIEIKKVIEERIVKNGKPVAKAPTMQSINGFGTTIYGDTVYAIALFIPIFAIGRYKVTSHGDSSYCPRYTHLAD
ncbi:MAG: hypothetical protein UR98_C0014G0015 [Parcubacteria group bacterium GW2011_GWA1_36_12]|uniref:Uncharacterized protein n=1 Tax=Candidatus Daviesbacteria bacterium GW2011_GWB1_41_5 TaxID=1618429 RepID=A0A0G0ZLM1_9BACT|nr:MAG: hypothetical protein UR98_C0014G0015 [Parcubacteria group bacterium GW2011_GWA1_36_12]KKS13878.1 MAG: hypothetical protein UU67_C0014G0012 [Candidatus Daviesbacteria bacterium GW2011_GWB1_41_5]